MNTAQLPKKENIYKAMFYFFQQGKIYYAWCYQ